MSYVRAQQKKSCNEKFATFFLDCRNDSYPSNALFREVKTNRVTCSQKYI